MRNGILAIVIFAVLGVIFAWGISKEQSDGIHSSKPTFKIGVILPISGNLANIGEGAKLAIAKLRDDIADSPVHFQLIVEDNNMSIHRTIMAANKLINLNKVNAIVSSFTGPATAVTPIATKNNILHICVANDCNVASGKTTFANWQHLSIAGKKMVELLQSKKAHKVVIFTMEDAGCALISENIRREFEKNNIRFEEFRFNPTERYFTTIVDKAMRIKGVDYWLLNTLSPGLELIRRQMILKKVQIPITGIQVFRDAQNPSLFKGAEYVEAAPVDAEFKDYMDKKGMKSETVPAYIYDSARMIVETVSQFYEKNNRLPTSQEIADRFLEMKKYTGVVGDIEISPERIMYSKTIITTFY